MLCLPPASAQAPGEFHILSTFKNIGMVLASVVGPGPVRGSQRLYASIAYWNGTFDILAIDPDSGTTVVLHSPLSGESAVWDMALAPDGNIYMGTAPGAHFLKLDTARGTVIDLGVPSTGEEYLWAIAVGSDHRIYGGTYPHCRLVRYDPSTGRLADLGRLDSSQQYARYLSPTPDGFLYAGIGSAAARIVAYQISTGKMQQILPPEAQVPGFAHTYAAADGNIYGLTPLFDYRISGWQATRIPESDVPDPAAQNTLSDGRVANLEEQNGALVLRLHSALGDSSQSITLDYTGEPNQLFRIGLGPDGKLYGSGALPSDLVRINDGTIDYLGSLGNGEAYSMLSYGPSLLLATYADTSTLVSFNPSRPFSTDAIRSNPQWVAIPDGDICWRPQAMVAGTDGLIYVGAQATYGELDGPLIVWNPADGAIRHSAVIPNQGVVSLATWKDQIIGGTTIRGGPGSTPATNDAQLFLWNPAQQNVTWQAVPVSGAQTITDLAVAPNGLVYGFADNTLFEFDPSTRQILRTQRTSVSGLIYNSIAADNSGRIWGLSAEGVFTLDTAQLQVTNMATPPAPITGGFALSAGSLYFIAGPEVYSYALPAMGFEFHNNSESSASIAAGGWAEFNLNVAPKAGFHGTVSLECSGLPPGTACSFAPPSLMSGGDSRLTISTAGPAATASLSRSPAPLLGIAAPCFWLALAGIVRRRRQSAWMLFLLAFLHSATGCGVTLTPNSAGPHANATPPGTYSITVSATALVGSSSMTQTTHIDLTVK